MGCRPNNLEYFDDCRGKDRKKMMWKPPSKFCIKLNFDGSVMMGNTMVGGIFCNSMGNLLVSYTSNHGGGSNNEVEALTLL